MYGICINSPRASWMNIWHFDHADSGKRYEDRTSKEILNRFKNSRIWIDIVYENDEEMANLSAAPGKGEYWAFSPEQPRDSESVRFIFVSKQARKKWIEENGVSLVTAKDTWEMILKLQKRVDRKANAQ